jgi:FkbM family methyltransferase
MSPSKQVNFGGHAFAVQGVSAEDGYFKSVDDGLDGEFYELCRRYVLPDFVCLDVGANIGIKSLYLSRHCPKGQVVAVEAGPSVVACLKANCAANAVGNVRIEQVAIGAEEGRVSFFEHSAWGYVSPERGSVQVPMTTLDALVGRLGLKRLDFLKIDVEGGEWPILKSSLELINRFESLVLVELNSWTQLAMAKSNPIDFIEWVMANFSQVFVVQRGNREGPLLTPVTDALELLHRNLVDDACVTDLLLTNAEWRLTLNPAFLAEQLNVSTARCRQLEGELSVAQERSGALQLDLEGKLTEIAQMAKLSKRELGAAQVRLEVVTKEAEQARAKCETLWKRCEGMRQSISWRLTAPLRWLRDRLEGRAPL